MLSESSHDHGNCQLCDHLETRLAAVERQISETAAVAFERACARDAAQAEVARLAAALVKIRGQYYCSRPDGEWLAKIIDITLRGERA